MHFGYNGFVVELKFFDDFGHFLAFAMARARATKFGIGVTHVQETNQLEIFRKVECAFDVRGVESAGPECIEP